MKLSSHFGTLWNTKNSEKTGGDTNGSCDENQNRGSTKIDGEYRMGGY